MRPSTTPRLYLGPKARRGQLEPVVCHMKAVRSPRPAKSPPRGENPVDDHGATIVLLAPLDWRINAHFSFLADARITMLQVVVR